MLAAKQDIKLKQQPRPCFSVDLTTTIVPDRTKARR
jgi:hypothetical protein